VHHLPPPSRHHAFSGSGCPNHDDSDSAHVNAWTTIVTPQTSSPMCWWWDWPKVHDDSGELSRYHAIYNKVWTKGALECVWPGLLIHAAIFYRNMHVAACNMGAICILRCNMDSFLLNQKGLEEVSILPKIFCNMHIARRNMHIAIESILPLTYVSRLLSKLWVDTKWVHTIGTIIAWPSHCIHQKDIGCRGGSISNYGVAEEAASAWCGCMWLSGRVWQLCNATI
jgi:hypothetical protein